MLKTLLKKLNYLLLNKKLNKYILYYYFYFLIFKLYTKEKCYSKTKFNIYIISKLFFIQTKQIKYIQIIFSFIFFQKIIVSRVLSKFSLKSDLNLYIS